MEPIIETVDLSCVYSIGTPFEHKALDRALQVENWKFKESVVFSKGNIESENGITYLPWYMVIFFHQEKEPDQMIYEIDYDFCDTGKVCPLAKMYTWNWYVMLY